MDIDEPYKDFQDSDNIIEANDEEETETRKQLTGLPVIGQQVREENFLNSKKKIFSAKLKVSRRRQRNPDQWIKNREFSEEKLGRLVEPNLLSLLLIT